MIMTVQVSIAKAKASFAELVSRAEAGEEVILTRHGRPVARLAPLRKQPPIAYGDLAGRGILLSDELSLPGQVIGEIEREIAADDDFHRESGAKPAGDK